jgi:hypothetical protein
MKPLFVRFGLPWLIFGASIYALCWNILYGERAYSLDVAPRIAARSFNAPAVISSAHEETKLASAVAIVKNEAPVPPENAHPQIAQSTAPMKTVRAAQSHPTDPRTDLQNADPGVRFDALAELDAQGITVPSDTLQQLATMDRDPSVRVLALTKYAQDPSVDPAMIRAAAEANTRDADPSVNANAHEILEQLSQATRSNDEMPSSNDAPVE